MRSANVGSRPDCDGADSRRNPTAASWLGNDE
eukprot:SAG25_NODE_5651_length_634_cov_1.536449_1_plen_31_part_10